MPDSTNLRVLIVFGVIALFGIITFALAAATLGTLNKQYSELKNLVSASTTTIATNTTITTTTTTQTSLNSPLAQSIRIGDLMNHLNELQRIANNSGNTRAIGTAGFSETLNYISNNLTNTPGLNNVFREAFQIQNFSIIGTPTLTLYVNGSNTSSFIYSADSPTADFTHVIYSANGTLTQSNFTVVPNNGCNGTDWQNVSGRVALVMGGGTCTYAEKGVLANSNNAAALLFYNNGLTASNLAPVTVRLRQANTIPALFLSHAVGKRLVDTISLNTGATISLSIRRTGDSFTVENICADTLNGLPSETIVVGSHSDSVPAGPGINDNGSGAIATLVLATNLARLYQNESYPKYRYRVRFCWWGAEEIGLVGSIYHVQNATRLQDYLINLNYDMLGSPNYMFGIYNGSSAKADTPQQALPGSIKISETFRDWFNNQSLPWDYTDFSGRSDYGPFLAAGVVAGGLFSGADDTKTSEQRLRYEQLGQGRGGFAGAIHDPCYHRACDTVDNIDRFGYEKMVQAAAYMLEYLGQQNNLTAWLYPNERPEVRLPDNYFPNSDYFREIGP